MLFIETQVFFLTSLFYVYGCKTHETGNKLSITLTYVENSYTTFRLPFEVKNCLRLTIIQ